MAQTPDQLALHFQRFLAKGPDPMAARWSDLLLRVHNTMDDADYDLSDADRNCFYAQLIAAGIRRRQHPRRTTRRHPLPSGDPLYTRDPTGD